MEKSARDHAISRCGKRDPARSAQIAFTQTVEKSGRPIALQMERGVPLCGGMKGKTTIQTKPADSFTSNTPGLPASFPPVFPFDEIIVTINSSPFAIISTSSAIVDDCERSI